MLSSARTCRLLVSSKSSYNTPLGPISRSAGRSQAKNAFRSYSTVKRRAPSDFPAQTTKFTSEDAVLTDKRKKMLDKEFDDIFFRKPKVLIIGTDIAAMTAALTLQAFKINPDILDVGHYMHPLAPTNTRGAIVPMNAMRVFEQLGYRRQIEAIGTPITLYGRADEAGKAFASLNYDSLRVYHDRPTLGVNYLELERTLQELVAQNSRIQAQCTVQAIESEPAPSTKMARVRWMRNYLNAREPCEGLYDAVIISDGVFSMTREQVWPEQFLVSSPVDTLETIIPRPPSIAKGYSSDQWGMDRRVGFFPIGTANRDLLYVYAQIRRSQAQDAKNPQPPTQQKLPSTALLEHFTDFTGPWRSVAEAVSAQPHVNSSPLIVGHFEARSRPICGRVVALGDSLFGFPTPCLGRDLGYSISSANFLGNVLALASTPVLGGLFAYMENVKNGIHIFDSARLDLNASVLFESRLPDMFKKFILRRSSSDSALVDQEIKILGLKLSPEEELDLTPLSRISSLREQWYSLDEPARQALRDNQDRDKQAAEAQLEQFLKAYSTTLAQEEEQRASKAKN